MFPPCSLAACPQGQHPDTQCPSRSRLWRASFEKPQRPPLPEKQTSYPGLTLDLPCHYGLPWWLPDWYWLCLLPPDLPPLTLLPSLMLDLPRSNGCAQPSGLLAESGYTWLCSQGHGAPARPVVSLSCPFCSLVHL